MATYLQDSLGALFSPQIKVKYVCALQITDKMLWFNIFLQWHFHLSLKMLCLIHKTLLKAHIKYLSDALGKNISYTF